MLTTLFTVTIIYEIIQILHLWFGSMCDDNSDITTEGMVLGSAFSIAILCVAAVASSKGGTFAFVTGIVYASLALLAMFANFAASIQRQSIIHGIYSIYNLVMMILFIVAVTE